MQGRVLGSNFMCDCCRVNAKHKQLKVIKWSYEGEDWNNKSKGYFLFRTCEVNRLMMLVIVKIVSPQN